MEIKELTEPTKNEPTVPWLVRVLCRTRRSLLFFAIRLFRVKDASERVARGFALGLSVNFFPTFGFGVLISGFVARVFGGNAVAGFIGGAAVVLFWPVLFFFNIQVGGLVFQPEMPVEDLEDVNRTTMNALLWGKTFMAGAIVNTLVVGLVVYLLLIAVHSRFRPAALSYFRRHARNYRKIPV